MGKWTAVFCNVGIHSYSNSRYDAVSETGHIQITTCIYCGAKKVFRKSSHHDFTPIEFVSLDNCDRQKVCRKCGYRYFLEATHEWRDGGYINEDSCLKKMICGRCGANGEQIEHEWEYASVAFDCSSKKCTRCDLKEMEEHNYLDDGPPEMYDVDHDMVPTKCSKCGVGSFRAWRV